MSIETPDFELVVPAYNEEKNLEGLIRRARDAAIADGWAPGQFRLVVVQNGSTDASSAVLARLSGSELGAWFRTVEIPVNQGYGYGIWEGLKSVRAPLAGWSHADQQCDPRDALRAARMLREGGSGFLIKGVRAGRHLADRFVSRTFEFIARLVLGVKVHEINAQPKVFRREFLAGFANPPKTFAFDLYALYQARKAGLAVRTIEVLFPSRIHGTSKWANNFFNRYKTILGMIAYMFKLARTEGRVR